jgi:hypothetical protein
VDRLRLEITRYTAPHQWYWALSDSAGGFVADNEVDLDPASWQCEAFARLGRFLRVNVDPGHPLSSEAEIVDRVGRWIGENIFGPIGPALTDRAPATVEVIFPTEARALMFRPWELAVAGDLPLARQEVSLVMVPPAAVSGRGKDAIGDRLRMLAVFSLPDAAPSLILREQRRALVRLADRIRSRHGKAIELSVLQYDVNRDRLRGALEDGAGWDIVHFSGHGLVDGLVLEGPEGDQDTVPTTELIDLLRPGRGQLKLLVLSSCNSAGAPPGEALAARFGQTRDGDMTPEHTLAVLADETAVRLDCGVLAMRYAVDDDFSIALAEHLYSSMLGSGQPLTRALQLALPKALGDRPRPGVPPLSAGIPALFGSRCLDLRLNPPRAPAATFATGNLKMAHFPDEPEHLIGRSGVMSAAARMLTGDGAAGIMFTGAAGLGKTTCAVELAYRHENTFGALAHWRTPARGAIGSLKDFAVALDRQLPGLEMAGQTTTTDRLTAFLPVLTELMERNAILILIDGADGLLTSDGYWRDPSWDKVVTALLDHRGYSRLVLTGRHRPAAMPGGLSVTELGPLTPQESVLLARQLPTLGSLIRGTGGIPMAAARRLLAGALTAAAGNPDQIRAGDQELADVSLAGRRVAAPVVPPSPDYVQLIDRWTYELS